MPIRRRDDGEIVEETTEPLGQKGLGSGSGERTSSDAPTDRLQSREQTATSEDSLFAPRQEADERGNRLEDPTVPIGADRGRDGETRIMSPRRPPLGEESTALDQNDPMLDPPVGWLVVVRGPGKGHVLTLGHGMNVIGRGPGARVRIDFGDDTIARANHSRLVYEPRQRRYLLNHGDGANLTYLNGEVVMGSMEIESGGMIEVGETTLRFQAFCSKEFDWSDIDD